MKPLIYLFFTFFLNNTAKSTHESISASFNVIERGYVLMLEIEFDMYNYLMQSNVTSHKVTLEEFSTYLNETTSWEFNGVQINPKVLSIKSEREHIKVICFLSKSKNKIKSIKVKNDFLSEVKDHSNIIKLDLNNSFKDFRLHKERKNLVVNYP
ncbi:MAG: hypothetical protein NWQ17_12975 [Polaribacter sp.]|nr:hypothetical protein [Polaribacter sp.]